MTFVLKYSGTPLTVYDDGGLKKEVGVDVLGKSGGEIISLLSENGFESSIEAFGTGIDAGVLTVNKINGGERLKVPWPDFAGNDLFEGDRIKHPSGEEGKIVYLSEHQLPEDQWRVNYGDGSLSCLILQIGDKGMAAKSV